MAEKSPIKLNKNHGGKEFKNNFRFIGLVKPVRKKEENGNWVDVPFYQITTTQTNKERRVLQFNVETTFRNELKLEVAGMEKSDSHAWSSKHRKSVRVDWADRFNKSILPDETYHFMTQEWDLSEDVGSWIKEGMYVDVRGEYEIGSFTNDEGKEIKTLKRFIQDVYPLKNGEITIKNVKERQEFKVYDSKEDGQQLGYGKSTSEGVVTIKVGWLNPKGGEVFICQITDKKEGDRFPHKYNDSELSTDRITVKNNIDSEITIYNDGKREKITYVRDFNDDNFVEFNEFEMQIGIKSTYQDEETKETKVNAVYLDHGKERSVPKDVELIVYYKEAEEGKTPLADAFARLNRLDFMKVKGIDNHRAEFALVEKQENEVDNPFADADGKVPEYERTSTGTKKGLEILNYVGGSYTKELLTEEEITPENNEPFTINIEDDDLPF